MLATLCHTQVVLQLCLVLGSPSNQQRCTRHKGGRQARSWPYHLVHEAAAFYLEDISISFLQDIKAVDRLDGVGVWVP